MSSGDEHDEYKSIIEAYQVHLDRAQKDKDDAVRKIYYWTGAIARLEKEYGEQDEQGSTELPDGRDGSQS